MTDDLPPVLREIAEAAGLKAALDLVAACGGQRLYVPHDPPPDGPLAKAVGVEAARAIAKRFAPDRLDVPNLASRSALLETQRLVEQGLNDSQIARALGIVRLTALRRRKRLKTDEPLPLLDLIEGGEPQRTRRR